MTAGLSVFPVRNSMGQERKRPYQRTGNEGTISGTVSFVGRVPPSVRIDKTADSVCARINWYGRTEQFVVNGGRFANVLVYVKSARILDELTFEPPRTPVIIDQRGCTFIPHVAGAMAEQAIEFRNSDPTPQNVHPTPKMNSEWNRSLVTSGTAFTTRFPHSEVAIPIKDNQHPWKKVYLGVFAHPFFSVSNKNGMFRIEGLPPGKYVIAAWHEQLGEQTSEATVLSNSATIVNFSFRLPQYRDIPAR